MTAAEGSVLGIAIQEEENSPESRDAQFKYLLYREGSASPNNIVIPLGAEVGGGALLRNVVKVGVNSGGGLSIYPRPDTLGMFLNGVTGSVTSSRNYRDAAIMALEDLDGDTISSGLGQPSSATTVYVLGTAGASGNVTINGTVSGSPDSEVIALSGTTRVEGSKLFSAITSVELPTDGGEQCSVGFYDGSYTHAFKLDPNDHFSAPFYTLRSSISPAKLNDWGEIFQDMRINMLAFEWRAPGYVEGAVAFVGGLPTPAVDTSSWAPLTYVDSGPQFLTSPGNRIQLPVGDSLSVLSGSFAAASAIPMDEQYIVGSYVPEGLEIVNRSFGINLNVKLPDEVLYHKMMYDPAAGSAWLAEIFREARLLLEFHSDQDAAAVTLTSDTTNVRPYSVKIEGNGLAGDNANIAWSMAPVGTRAQRQVVAALTGTFMASPNPSYDPITVTLVNRRSSYAYVAP